MNNLFLVPTIDNVNFSEESVDVSAVAAALSDTAMLDSLWASLKARLDARVSDLVNSEGLWLHDVYLGHSGGKDSCLTHALLNSTKNFSGASYQIIHTCKPQGLPNATHPATQTFLYYLSAASKQPIVNVPEESFKSYLDDNNLLVQIDGTRADEAERSNGRSTDLVIDGQSVDRANMGLFNRCGLFDRSFIYPLFDVTTPLVWALLIHRKIEISREYEKC